MVNSIKRITFVVVVVDDDAVVVVVVAGISRLTLSIINS